MRYDHRTKSKRGKYDRIRLNFDALFRALCSLLGGLQQHELPFTYHNIGINCFHCEYEHGKHENEGLQHNCIWFCVRA